MNTNENRDSALPAPGRRQLFAGAVALAGGLSLGVSAQAGVDGEILRTAEAIHQETVFKTGRKKVYEALTQAVQFQKVIDLSAAMQSMGISRQPAEISSEAGGAFSIFGGHIIGRHIELVPEKRIVQAWRVVNWDPGVYSIALFELVDQAGATKLVFDHTGFPPGQAAHLAEGWRINYWEPLAKVLA